MTSDISVAWQDWETVSAASQKTHSSEVQPWKTTKKPSKIPQPSSPTTETTFVQPWVFAGAVLPLQG